MDNPLEKNGDRVLISGEVLRSTIETMAALGELGQQMLKNYGIEDIDPNGFYPYSIRNAIHKAVFDRFGGIALRAMGFRFGKYFPIFETQKIFESVERD